MNPKKKYVWIWECGNKECRARYATKAVAEKCCSKEAGSRLAELFGG